MQNKEYLEQVKETQEIKFPNKMCSSVGISYTRKIRTYSSPKRVTNCDLVQTTDSTNIKGTICAYLQIIPRVCQII